MNCQYCGPIIKIWIFSDKFSIIAINSIFLKTTPMDQIPPEMLNQMPEMMAGLGGMFAFVAGFFMVFLIIMVVVGILSLMNFFHLITTDSPNFKDGMDGKKRWYYIFFLLPLAMIIPLVNFIVGIALLVLHVFYFFSIRTWKKS